MGKWWFNGGLMVVEWGLNGIEPLVMTVTIETIETDHRNSGFSDDQNGDFSSSLC